MPDANQTEADRAGAEARLDAVTEREARGRLPGGGTVEILAGERVLARGEAGPEGAFTLPLPGGVGRLPVSARRAGGEALAGMPRTPLPRGRPARVLVMIPAGLVYDHDKVRVRDSVLAGQYANIGDLMVFESTLRLLDFAEVRTLEIVEPTEELIATYNRDYDLVFLRGSNFVHEGMDFRRAVEVLERLTIPVVAVGVGAQAASRRRIVLPPEGRRVWRAIAERCAAIGARGEYSAEVLAENGIGNVEVVGCPSLFRARDRGMRLRRAEPAAARRVAFSLRRETGANYAREVSSYLGVQREAMLRLDRECDLTVTVHGEAEEKAFALRQADKLAGAEARLRQLGWITPGNEARMLDLYRNRLFFFTRVGEYDELVRRMDFALGYRVHGVLPALANGTPSLLVDYDERSAELARTHRVPLIAEAALRDRPWRELLAEADLDGFEAAFPAGYDRMRGHLERNGVPHRM